MPTEQPTVQAVVNSALNALRQIRRQQDKAEGIVALVAKGEIAHVLAQIENFGYCDQEGLRRKFTLYMICLMEVTLNGSRHKSFRRSACEQLLRDLDEHLPVDRSMLRWNDFFPSYLVFRMAAEWAEMGLDHRPVFKRTDRWDADWIETAGPHSEIQLDTLAKVVDKVGGRILQNIVLKKLAVQMAAIGKVPEARNLAQRITDTQELEAFRVEAPVAMAQQGHAAPALAFAQEIPDAEQRDAVLHRMSHALAGRQSFDSAHIVADLISAEPVKRTAHLWIEIEYAKHHPVEHAEDRLQTALDDLQAANCSEDEKRFVQLGVVEAMIRQGMKGAATKVLQKTLDAARNIADETMRCQALLALSSRLTGKFADDLQGTLMMEAQQIERETDDPKTQKEVRRLLAIEMAHQGLFEEGWENADPELFDEIERALLHKIFLTQMARRGLGADIHKRLLESIRVEVDEQTELFRELCRLETYEIEDEKKSAYLLAIAVKLAKKGRYTRALELSRAIPIETQRLQALLSLYSELSAHHALAADMLLPDLRYCSNNYFDLPYELSPSYLLLKELLRQGKVGSAIAYAKETRDTNTLLNRLKTVWEYLMEKKDEQQAAAVLTMAVEKLSKSSELYTRLDMMLWIWAGADRLGLHDLTGKVWDRAVQKAEKSSDPSLRVDAFLAISDALARNGKKSEAEEFWEKARAIGEEAFAHSVENPTRKELARSLVRQGKTEGALRLADEVADPLLKSPKQGAIASEMALNGRSEEALPIARSIEANIYRDAALRNIARELALGGNMPLAVEAAREILDPSSKSTALSEIAEEMAKTGNLSDAAAVAREIPDTAHRLNSWQWLGQTAHAKWGPLNAFYQSNQLTNEEAHHFCLKGWANALRPHEADDDFILEVVPKLLEHPEALEQTLRMFAFRLLFFDDYPVKNVRYLFKFLSIQWMLDYTEDPDA